MPTSHTGDDLKTDRPVQDPRPPARERSSRTARRAASCLRLAATTDEGSRRRWRVQDTWAAGRLTICSERDGTTHRIAVFGELDIATAQGVEDELKAVAATDAEHVVLDLSGLAFIDSSGVHLIARVNACCRASGKRLRLEHSPPHVTRILELAAADALPFAA